MFSSRLAWDHPLNDLTRALERKRGQRLYDLTESNPTRAGIAGLDITGLADARAAHYHPSALGLIEAREAVVDYYARRGACVHVDQVLLTASTSEAYGYLFKLLCDAGDEILAPAPSYPLLEHLAGLECVRVRPYRMHYQEGWWIEPVEAGIAKAVIAVSPNNPAGSYLNPGDMQMFERTGLPLICDEVFADYRLDGGPVQSVAGGEEGGLRFALSGLSKVCGLPQMKLSWIVASGRGWREAMRRLEWIADTYLSVSAPVQYAATRWLPQCEEFQARLLARLRGNLCKLKGALHIQGGWYAVVPLEKSRTDAEWALHLLNHHNVLVQPGYFYDFAQESIVVVSLLTKEDDFAHGIAVLGNN